MGIGNQIKTARKERRLTQKQLADKIGVAEITIRQYEADKRQPSIDQLKRIADALNVTLGYLLGRDDLHSREVFEPMLAMDLETMQNMGFIPPDGVSGVSIALDAIKDTLTERERELVSAYIKLLLDSRPPAPPDTTDDDTPEE